MTESAGSLLAEAARQLRAARSTSPRLDAELLLGHVLGRSRTEVLAHPERSVGGAVVGRFAALVARRVELEPMAYVLGAREFYGREFRVDRRALIPRPETELLVELGTAAVARLQAVGVAPTVVEVGTGSGAVAISLALEAHLAVCATEVSRAALSLARENAEHLAAPVRFVQTDLLAGLRGPIHVLLANLSYVPST
ncbi:MAG TPA: HemK/PrmC family methyltransferase, partial [Chloroflexota bacterium]